MKIGDAHLTYCTNIHAGDDVFEMIDRHVVAVKARVCPDRAFGVGLRLSAKAAYELDAHQLRAFLDERDLYAFTINGFPYGNFHGTRVKEAVYLPDWLDDERVKYTCRLADILRVLAPPGVYGSISTVPGCFRARGVDLQKIRDNLHRCSNHLLHAGTHLALEPEPACLFETTAEAVQFLSERPIPGVGLCLDACHAAVEFEQPVRPDYPIVHKVQLSCGLRVTPVDAAARADLGKFADDVYLHQVVARRGNDLVRYVDLPDALADPADADEWRIHFHVPIFREALGRFASTQPFLAALLAQPRLSTHLEVETYTWDVLPAEFRAEPIEDAIARELRWVMERLA